MEWEGWGDEFLCVVIHIDEVREERKTNVTPTHVELIYFIHVESLRSFDFHININLG